MAERVGFEPTCRGLADNPISSRARYGHFATSPWRKEYKKSLRHATFYDSPKSQIAKSTSGFLYVGVLWKNRNRIIIKFFSFETGAPSLMGEKFILLSPGNAVLAVFSDAYL